MAPVYQIIEISVDADGNEGDRPGPSITREKGVNRINNLLSRCKLGRFDKEKGYWLCTAMNDDRTHFMIEAI
jgi:hypothetical protein